MKKYLTIICILSLFTLPNVSFAEKIKSVMLGNYFESGIIEANTSIVQSETFQISKESIKWFIQANIYPKEFHNKRVYPIPYKVYLAINESTVCYEEFNLFVIPLSSLIVVERTIINLTSESQTYSSYGGTLVKYKLR